MVTSDPYLLPLVKETRPILLKGEYCADGVAYGLEGEVVKSFDLQRLKYTLIFETIVEAH